MDAVTIIVKNPTNHRMQNHDRAVHHTLLASGGIGAARSLVRLAPLEKAATVERCGGAWQLA
jgi:hypothetical protein